MIVRRRRREAGSNLLTIMGEDGGRPTERVVTSVADPKPSKDAPTAGEADGESDVQRRMREALEAKQARNKAAHGEDHKTGRRDGPSTNDKHQRQFRRKSG
jgi:hypothetical protein